MKTKIVAALSLLIIFASFSFKGVDKRSVKRNPRNNEPTGTVYIIIDKSDYELSVYDDKGWYATYPVVFGNSSL